MTASRKVALVGFMGAGKTTAARSLGAGAVDVDEVIEERLGLRVQDVFARDGEAAFREIEERVTLELLADPSVRVVGLGGGALGSDRVRDAVREATVVWLDVDVDEAWRRVADGGGLRPLASDPARFEQLHARRAPVYEEVADVIVPASRSREIGRVLSTLEGVPRSRRPRAVGGQPARRTTRSTSARDSSASTGSGRRAFPAGGS